jgi:hypothetical protein
MIDQTTPPFRTGDTAWTRASPGGYASAAAVPVDPAYGGTDNAYLVPSLGGEFQPGSGMAAPTSSPITKGADADGGAADIAGAPRIDVPPVVAPPVIPALSVTVDGFNLIFLGKAAAAKVVDVQYEVNDDGIARHVAGIAIPIGTSAGAAAAIVAGRINGAAHLTAATTSNEVRVAAKTPNVIGADPLLCTIT